MPEICDFLVDRKNIGRWRWYINMPGADLEAGEISVIHHQFALTANNITYARCGEALRYWAFFPAPEPWGSIPVWGRGRVERSRCADIAEGERVYGFFPMSNRLVLRPTRIKSRGFIDGKPHRVDLARTYNEYVRIDHDPDYDDALADLHLVLLPLFNLSFFLAHFLAEGRFSGAGTVIVSSASSKAAIGLAFELRRIGTPGLNIVGLTVRAKSRSSWIAATAIASSLTRRSPPRSQIADLRFTSIFPAMTASSQSCTAPVPISAAPCAPVWRVHARSETPMTVYPGRSQSSSSRRGRFLSGEKAGALRNCAGACLANGGPSRPKSAIAWLSSVMRVAMPSEPSVIRFSPESGRPIVPISSAWTRLDSCSLDRSVCRSVRLDH